MAIEVGSIYEGTVSGIRPFGAFVTLPEGKVGLVHISQVSEDYIQAVSDVLKEKDVVKVKVINIDENGKIGLSIKAASPRKEGQGMSKPKPRPKSPQQEQGSPDDVPMALRRSNTQIDTNRTRAKFSPGSQSFEDKISKFMKDSEEILRDSNRRTDSKRGGRGGRRR